ncbi:MAG: ATP-dependent Clp protease ATP-binding subunit [Myxococcales bacterium]|nr:MAG: ATP-dependent Clp protease ATP-binding subunit [Myxococcales bacterium]
MGKELATLLGKASRAARRRGQTLTTSHLLLVMLQHGGKPAAVLAENGLSEAALAAALKKHSDESLSAMEVSLEKASRLAQGFGLKQPGVLHLLLALSRESRSAAYRCLAEIVGSPTGIEQQALDLLGQGGRRIASRQMLASTSKNKTVARAILNSGQTFSEQREEKAKEVKVEPKPQALRVAAPSKTKQLPQENLETGSYKKIRGSESLFALDSKCFPVLAKLGHNLSLDADMGALDCVVGRQQDIETLLDVLARRKANNPVVVGPPGVGKTALVHGLVSRMVREARRQNEVNPTVVVEMGVGSLIAGTAVRGALTERLRMLADELKAAKGRVLLFVDDIHTILAAGDAVDELSSEFKALLARGAFPVLGLVPSENTTDILNAIRHLQDSFSECSFRSLLNQSPSKSCAE